MMTPDQTSITDQKGLYLRKMETMTKGEILQRIREKLESNVRELESSLESLRSASNIDESDTLDPEDYSQQSESRDREMAMQLQLDAAHAQLARLEDFSGKKVSIAESGALIETDRNWFFLGISLSLNVDGKELYGVSPDTPAFNPMKGKSMGEVFKIGNNEHRIINIC